MGDDVVEQLRPPDDRARSTFGYDLRWSVSCWRRAPWFVALVVLLPLTAFVLTGRLAVAQLLVWLVLGGMAGTDRVFFLRCYLGYSLEAREVWSLTWSFVGRFLLLGLVVSVPAGVVVGIVGAIVFRPERYGSTAGWFHFLLPLLALALVAHVLLTFVVPALALTTKSLRAALGSGLAMLARTWPACSWYALAPGLTVVVVVFSLPVPAPALGVGGGVGGEVGLAVTAGCGRSPAGW